MDRMKEHSALIVEQALLVGHELIRVAILWHELWHEGLEEASRLYFTDKNPEGMIAFLEPLHDMLEAVSCECHRDHCPADTPSRDPKLLEKHPSLKCLVEIYTKHGKHADVIKSMAKGVILTRLGKSTTEYVDVCSLAGGDLTIGSRCSARSKSNCHSSQ